MATINMQVNILQQIRCTLLISFLTQGLADSQACMHAVYVCTATLNFLHTPLHSDSMLGVAKTLNICHHKTYIACIYLTPITSGKLLPDGDELWTE